MPQYVTQVTKEQMEADSKKATAEEMKKLLKKINEDQEPDTYSDSNSDYDSSSRLETRIHYMKLDIVNLNVELIKYKDALEAATKTDGLLKKIDNELTHLSGLKFYLKDIDTLSIKQLHRKIFLFKEEEAEHIQLCLKNVAKIELSAIRDSVQISIAHKKKQNRVIEKQLTYALNKKWVIEQIHFATFMLCILIIIALVLMRYV